MEYKHDIKTTLENVEKNEKLLTTILLLAPKKVLVAMIISFIKSDLKLKLKHKSNGN